MKRVCIVLFCFAAMVCFAENPFLGTWKAEIICVNEEFTWTITEERIVTTDADGTESVSTYDLDVENRTLVMKDSDITLNLVYREHDNAIDLIMVDIRSTPLYQPMVQSLEAMKGMNSLTDEVMEALVDVLVELLETAPVIRLVRAE